MDLIRFNRDLFYTKDGVICLRFDDSWLNEVLPEFQGYLEKLGIRCVIASLWEQFLRKSVGKPESVFFNEVKRRAEISRKYIPQFDGRNDLYRQRQFLMADWRENEKARFGGMIVGIDKNSFDRSTRDFSFSISLRSCAFQEQLKFVRENVQELKNYSMERVQEYKFFKRHIGSLDFYYISEMILTRDSQIRVIFSVKKGIEKVLMNDSAENTQNDK